MKKPLYLLCLIGFLSCTEKKEFLTFINSGENNVLGYEVSIDKKDFYTSFASLNETQIFSILDEKKKAVPFQLEDWDGDGAWDKVFFQLDIVSGQKRGFQIMATESAPEFKAKTGIHFGKFNADKSVVTKLTQAERLTTLDNSITQKHFQCEGPCWENDKVAFRNYFDLRNGIDIFGKKTAELVMADVGILGDNYHELQDWGMDILKVGNSLGAGSVALKYQDSLYRLTSEKANFKQLFQGPLRSAFELNFEDVSVGTSLVNVRHIISISAGNYYYESKVILSKNVPGISVVSGIVNMHSTVLRNEVGSNSSCYYTFDKQAYNGEFLGIGIMVHNNAFIADFATKDEGEGIVQTHAVEMNPDTDYAVSFKFYSGWQLASESFSSTEMFDDFIANEIKNDEGLIDMRFGN